MGTQPQSLETLQRRLRSAELAIETAQLDVNFAEAKRQSVDRRLATTVASYNYATRQES